MSVVGVDLGNLSVVIAVARKRGIDVICNEVSNRATPSLVGFGIKNRFIGESAKSQEISNLKNTVGSLKRLIGGNIEEEKQYIANRVEADGAGDVLVRVNYMGEERTFRPVELIAMLLTKVKEITCSELQSQAVQDIVMSCPAYFTDAQRRKLMDAAEIAGLKCIRLLNDSTAAALNYGMTKAADMSDDTARNVCFVDVGHSNCSVAVVSFWKSKMEVKAVSYDSSLGGRSFDEVLSQCIADEIKQTKNVDIRTSPKAMYRLRAAAERAKKILSANLKTPVHVESISEEQDFATDFTRERFEALIAGLVDRVEKVILSALGTSSLSPDLIHSVELVGGSVRIPAIKERIARLFGNREPGSTMNQDEAVARGCALQAAMLSPTFKSRPYSVQDCVVLPVLMSWEPTAEEPEDREAIVFPVGNALPSTKLLSFSRSLPFDVVVSYPGSPAFSAATIGGTSPVKISENAVVKVKAKMSLCHLVSIESAQIIETDNEAADKTKKTDVPVTWVHSSLGFKDLETMKENEGTMAANDRLVRDTEIAQNALEEYIYSSKSKLENEWSLLRTEQEKTAMLNLLGSTESWLYEGEEVSKSVYQKKLGDLKTLGDPIHKRLLEQEERPRAAGRLREQCASYMAFADDKSSKYEHIGEGDRETVRKACSDVDFWLNNMLAKQASIKPWEKPAVTAAQIDAEKERLINIVAPIMLKQRPAAPPAPQPTPKSDASSTDKKASDDSEIPEMEMD